MKPDPFPPPGHPHVPTLPKRLPTRPHERKKLETMVQEALETKLTKRDMEVVCYLIRRAHGMGMIDRG